MPLRYDTITFLSDYGHADEFVGVVHSVIRSITPDAAVVDLTHDIAPHDVRAAGLLLARSAQYLCPGVVLAVVDPGVGGDRRCVAVEVGDGMSVLVGPDNGLLAPAVAMVGGATRAVELTNTDFHLPAAGATFAGRDIFAPVAAQLCQGVDLAELGERIEPGLLQPGVLPLTRADDGAVMAPVQRPSTRSSDRGWALWPGSTASMVGQEMIGNFSMKGVLTGRSVSSATKMKRSATGRSSGSVKTKLRMLWQVWHQVAHTSTIRILLSRCARARAAA